jgi:hypothetical protein
MSAIERKGCAAEFLTLENIFPPGDSGEKTAAYPSNSIGLLKA